MYVIAHRGGAGLAPENTLLAIEASVKAKADAIEIDVQVTKDGRLVLVHDDTLLRIAGTTSKTNELTYAQIKKINTKSGEPIPSLEEALKVAGKTSLVIEGKGSGWAKPLAQILTKHKGPKPKVISFNHRELLLFAEMMRTVETYACEDHRAFEVMALAKRLGFSGVSLAFWLYNPLTYMHANRLGLKLITSPYNKPWRVRIFHLLYPKAQITTDFPDRFMNRHKKRR